MSLKDALLGLLFPPVCLLCGEREEKDGLCASCRKKFARETFLRCPVCHETADRCLCGTDLLRGANTELAGRRFLALTWYVPVKNAAEEPDRVTEKMILMLKDRASFADFFAGELARELNRLFEQAGADFLARRRARPLARRDECDRARGVRRDSRLVRDQPARGRARLLGPAALRALARGRHARRALRP